MLVYCKFWFDFIKIINQYIKATKTSNPEYINTGIVNNSLANNNKTNSLIIAIGKVKLVSKGCQLISDEVFR